MAVLDRSSLEESPLADLHVIARELGIDGFRRLRKADLIDAILERQGGDGAAGETSAAAETAEEKPKRARRSRRKKDADVETEAEADAAAEAAAAPPPPSSSSEEGTTDEDADERPSRRSRSRRSRSRDEARNGGEREDAAEERTDKAADRSDKVAEGTVELLGNGSGFLRVSPPDASDDDVYVSAAQVRRCELVSGDVVAGPVRAPRRSERYPSLIRIDTINGRPADEVSEGTPFDELPAQFPTERFALGSDDATLKAIEWLTPLGRGSRVTITGAARSGKSEALRRLAGALAKVEGLELSVVLAGARPEEIAEWKASETAPAAALTLAASADAQAGAVERALDTAKRIAARGGDAVVLVDSLSGLAPGVARRTLAAARDIVDGGSLTIVATADEPVGGGDHGHRAGRDADLDRALPGARPGRVGHAAARAAGRRGRRGRDRPGARRGARLGSGVPRAARSARHVCHSAPRRLGGELDRLAVALGLDVGEGLRVDVEGDVELALLHALVQPGAAEHQPPQPVHEAAVGRPHELGPAVVDVLAQLRGGVGDLAVDREVDQVLELGLAEPAADEAELHRRLLAALLEVALVEGEPELAVFEDEVLAGVVVAASLCVHAEGRRGRTNTAGRRRGILPKSSPRTRGGRELA